MNGCNHGGGTTWVFIVTDPKARPIGGYSECTRCHERRGSEIVGQQLGHSEARNVRSERGKR